MSLTFVGISLLTLLAAGAAIGLRNLVHSALCLAVSFIGLAAAYLALDAQFLGLAQVLVYVGAVAVLIVFAILLTRGGGNEGRPVFHAAAWSGAMLALAVFGVLAWGIAHASFETEKAPRSAPVAEIGKRLMGDYVLPLEAVGVLLTVALIGAVIVAWDERPARVPGEKAVPWVRRKGGA